MTLGEERCVVVSGRAGGDIGLTGLISTFTVKPRGLKNPSFHSSITASILIRLRRPLGLSFLILVGLFLRRGRASIKGPIRTEDGVRIKIVTVIVDSQDQAPLNLVLHQAPAPPV